MARRTERPALLVRVLTEIGAGRIFEGWISDKAAFIHGETDGRSIRVNPAVAVVDTVIHEVLHRLEPAWSEAYVRRTTTWLMRRMSDEQIRTMYDEYQRIAKRRKRAKPGIRETPARHSGPARREEQRLCDRCRSAEQLPASGSVRDPGVDGHSGEDE